MQAGWLWEAPPTGLALGSPGPHPRGWSYAPHFLPRGFTCVLRYPSGWLVGHPRASQFFLYQQRREGAGMLTRKRG